MTEPLTREWLDTPEGQLHSAVTDSLPDALTTWQIEHNWRRAADAFIRHLEGQGYEITPKGEHERYRFALCCIDMANESEVSDRYAAISHKALFPELLANKEPSDKGECE